MFGVIRYALLRVCYLFKWPSSGQHPFKVTPIRENLVWQRWKADSLGKESLTVIVAAAVAVCVNWFAFYSANFFSFFIQCTFIKQNDKSGQVSYWAFCGNEKYCQYIGLFTLCA